MSNATARQLHGTAQLPRPYHVIQVVGHRLGSGWFVVRSRDGRFMSGPKRTEKAARAKMDRIENGGRP